MKMEMYLWPFFLPSALHTGYPVAHDALGMLDQPLTVPLFSSYISFLGSLFPDFENIE